MKKALEQAQELLKAAKDNPEQFQDLEKKYVGFKAVAASAKASGARDPNAVAAAVGRKKYGKEKFQEAAAHHRKMDKTSTIGLSLSEDKAAKSDANYGAIAMAEKDGKSKHDRCVEHVKENSPDVKNPHAVCVAEGVKPAAWKKDEKSMDKHAADGDTGEIKSDQPMKKDSITDAMGVASSEKPMTKDDKPHPPNSPQDKAHDVAEHTDTISHAMKILDTPESQRAMLAHLRTLHDPENMRSDKNREAGMTPAEKAKENKMDKAEMLKAAKELLELAKNEPQKFEELTKMSAVAGLSTSEKPMDKAAPALAAPKMAAPKMAAPKMAAPKAPAMAKPPMTAPAKPKMGMRMTKDEIKADLSKPWSPKHYKKGCA